MKLSMALLLASMLVFSGVAAAHDRDDDCTEHHIDRGFLHNCDVDWDEEDGVLVISNEDDDDEVVEITKKYELFVNGDLVKLDRSQKGLVKDYYRHFKKLHKMAEEIGEEGARIGAKGGKIAGVVLKNLCKLIEDGDDAEEFEEEIEREAGKLEAEAERLEAKAEILGEIADNLEELHYDMKEAIPELDDLEWF